MRTTDNSIVTLILDESELAIQYKTIESVFSAPFFLSQTNSQLKSDSHSQIHASIRRRDIFHSLLLDKRTWNAVLVVLEARK